jgi:nucleoside-diphosphate-sugar epimerase
VKAIIAGCGFLGEAAAGLFLKQGWQVLGLCAREESLPRLRARGLDCAAMDISSKLEFPEEWRDVDLLIHCASSGRGGPDAYRRVYVEGLKNLIAATSARKLLFTSSTSVYAQSDGSLVTEADPAAPVVETGKYLLEAEKVALDAGGCVLRLAGIYGPGRSVLLRKYQEGTAVLENGGGRWINQIHRDDAAAALVHAAEHDLSGIYNVADDSPATQKEVYGWIAEAMKGDLPPGGPAPLTRKRGITNKRVSNTKLRMTGWTPSFPSYRDALLQIKATGREEPGR